MALGALATAVAGQGLGMLAGNAIMGSRSDDVVDARVGGLSFERVSEGLDPAQLQQMLDDLTKAEGIARGDLQGGFDEAQAILDRAHQTVQQFGAPAQEANTAALQQLLAMSGLTGEDPQAILERLQQTPGFQFQQQQGQQAVERSAASRGLLESGALTKDLTRFGQGLAEQSFGAEQQRLLGLVNATSNQALAGQAAQTSLRSQQAANALGIGQGLGDVSTRAAEQRASALQQGGIRTRNTSNFNIDASALDVTDLLNEVPSFGGFVAPESSSVRTRFGNPLNPSLPRTG